MRGSARYFFFSRMNLVRFLIKIDEGNTRRRRKSNSGKPFKNRKRNSHKRHKKHKTHDHEFCAFCAFCGYSFSCFLKWSYRIRFSSAPGISLFDLYKKPRKVHPTERKVPGRAPHLRRLELERESY